MKVLIANDKFKGSLTAVEAAEAIRKGFPDDWVVDFCPIADGGEGFTETIISAVEGKWLTVDTVDALLRPLQARIGLTKEGLAVMEMAAASGFEHIAPEDQDVLNSSTYGTGLLIQHAVKHGAKRILIGIGGSATNDGGTGMADALGVLFLDKEEDSLPALPSSLDSLDSIDRDQRPELPPIHVACDVDNPLLGPNGATAIYGPQKGAGPKEQEILEAFLEKLVTVSGTQELAEHPGAGAAGGLGFGLMYFAGAELKPGFDLVAEALHLEDRIAEADLVVTGEGSLDAQSLSGKGPIGVAKLALELGTPAIAIAGSVSEEVKAANLFEKTGALTDFQLPLDESMARASQLVTKKMQELIASR